jgi:hypothetical protein
MDADFKNSITPQSSQYGKPLPFAARRPKVRAIILRGEGHLARVMTLIERRAGMIWALQVESAADVCVANFVLEIGAYDLDVVVRQLARLVCVLEATVVAEDETGV